MRTGKRKPEAIHMRTYPYRRPVGEVPSNDIPFIIKSSAEFPSLGEVWVISRTVTDGIVR
jgi:hypothetical protein